jgi:hypothetical protein
MVLSIQGIIELDGSITMQPVTRLDLRLNFGWEADPAFSPSELDLLYRTGLDLIAKAERCLPGMGRAWLLQRLSPLRLHLGGLPQRLASLANRQATSIVFPRWDVWLVRDIERRSNPQVHIAHELAHALDNRLARRSLPATIFGGGPADRLIRALGGSPRGLRFANGLCGLPADLRWTANDGYGNRSSAEYFTEAFAWSVYDPSRLPTPALQEWMAEEIFRM